MTRKDYIMIAKRFRYYMGRVAAKGDRKGAERIKNQKLWIAALARDIALDLAEDNPRFKYDRFLHACGVAS
jgi:predicted nucleic acid-binding protein